VFEELIPIEECTDPKYIKFIKAKPCLMCKNPLTEPHHCEGVLPSRGLAVKHDLLAVPLCRDCHNLVHQAPADFWEYHGIDIKRQIIYYLIEYYGRKI
jgi:hypothetical protein